MSLGEQRGLSEVTGNVRRVYELLGIEVPKELLYHAQMFDPRLMFPAETEIPDFELHLYTHQP